MQPPSDFVIEPPDDQTPEGWLSKYDSRPRLIPRWPESKRMTLVAVVVEDLQQKTESEAVGYVITAPSQADALMEMQKQLDSVAVLFFSVPRMRLLDYCPGLCEDSWVTPVDGGTV